MFKTIRGLALALILVLSTGCVSVIATAYNGKPWSGVRVDGRLAFGSHRRLGVVRQVVLRTAALLDLPASAVLDALLLPFTW